MSALAKLIEVTIAVDRIEDEELTTIINEIDPKNSENIISQLLQARQEGNNVGGQLVLHRKPKALLAYLNLLRNLFKNKDNTKDVITLLLALDLYTTKAVEQRVAISYLGLIYSMAYSKHLTENDCNTLHDHLVNRQALLIRMNSQGSYKSQRGAVIKEYIRVCMAIHHAMLKKELEPKILEALCNIQLASNILIFCDRSFIADYFELLENTSKESTAIRKKVIRLLIDKECRNLLLLKMERRLYIDEDLTKLGTSYFTLLQSSIEDMPHEETQTILEYMLCQHNSLLDLLLNTNRASTIVSLFELIHRSKHTDSRSLAQLLLPYVSKLHQYVNAIRGSQSLRNNLYTSYYETLLSLCLESNMDRPYIELTATQLNDLQENKCTGIIYKLLSNNMVSTQEQLDVLCKKRGDIYNHIMHGGLTIEEKCLALRTIHDGDQSNSLVKLFSMSKRLSFDKKNANKAYNSFCLDEELLDKLIQQIGEYSVNKDWQLLNTIEKQIETLFRRFGNMSTDEQNRLFLHKYGQDNTLGHMIVEHLPPPYSIDSTLTRQNIDQCTIAVYIQILCRLLFSNRELHHLIKNLISAELFDDRKNLVDIARDVGAEHMHFDIERRQLELETVSTANDGRQECHSLPIAIPLYPEITPGFDLEDASQPTNEMHTPESEPLAAPLYPSSYPVDAQVQPASSQREMFSSQNQSHYQGTTTTTSTTTQCSHHNRNQSATYQASIRPKFPMALTQITKLPAYFQPSAPCDTDLSMEQQQSTMTSLQESTTITQNTTTATPVGIQEQQITPVQVDNYGDRQQFWPKSTDSVSPSQANLADVSTTDPKQEATTYYYGCPLRGHPVN